MSESDSDGRSDSDSEEPQQVNESMHKQKKKHDQRRSVEDKIDTLNSTVLNLQNLMKDRGFFDKPSTSSNSTRDKKRRSKSRDRGKDTSDHCSATGTSSNTAIYNNAVQFQDELVRFEHEQQVDKEISFRVKNRDSSSSEDKIDTSDELMEIDLSDEFIADCSRRKTDRNDQHKSTDHRQRQEEVAKQLSHGDQIIRDAEASKARMLRTPGECNLEFLERQEKQHSAVVDKNYMVVGAHLDESIHQRIVNNEYIDFSKLLNRELDHSLKTIEWSL